MGKQDQHFDGIAQKFSRNIYGTSKGRLRHQILFDRLSERLSQHTKLKVIDIGGGNGIMSEVIAEWGHNVTLIDASADILAEARQRLGQYKTVSIEHKTLQALDDLYQYDVLICHAVMEWLADPKQALEHIAAQMRPGAQLSLTFFNRDAALFGNILYGNFDYIARGMKVKNQVRLNPNNPISPSDMLQWCKQSGLQLGAITGIRCFHDYLKDKCNDEETYQNVLSLEREHCQREPFMWLGKYMHCWLTKR